MLDEDFLSAFCFGPVSTIVPLCHCHCTRPRPVLYQVLLKDYRQALLPSKGAHPGEGQAHPQIPVTMGRLCLQGHSHFRSAFWYRRPCVCRSTCSGALLMCLRVSLQKSWRLRGKGTSVQRARPAPPSGRCRNRQMLGWEQAGGLRCGLGLRSLNRRAVPLCQRMEKHGLGQTVA